MVFISAVQSFIETIQLFASLFSTDYTNYRFMYLSVFLLQLFYFHLIVHLCNYSEHISIMAVINTALAMFSHQSPRLTRENSFYKFKNEKKSQNNSI